MLRTNDTRSEPYALFGLPRHHWPTSSPAAILLYNGDTAPAVGSLDCPAARPTCLLHQETPLDSEG
jgi:hypothetical protein